MTNKKCLNCQTEFEEIKNKSKKFCSFRCRTNYWRMNNKKKEYYIKAKYNLKKLSPKQRAKLLDEFKVKEKIK